jgi:pimeloyl-ACP methyl ester carboxylesterase
MERHFPLERGSVRLGGPNVQKRLVLFVHGIGGSAADTWQEFPALLQQDAELSAKYEVGLFEYTTGVFRPGPAFTVVAESLKTEIESRYAAFGDITIIAYSQGGLIARQYIADRINAGERLPVRRLLTFATPHLGSLLATLGKWVPGTSEKIKALAQDSDFIMGLAKAWGQANADTRVRTKYVIAADDRIVGPMSAVAGSWAATYDAVTGVGHKTVVKPASSEEMSFAIVKRFLLEELALLGAAEADYRQPLLHYRYVEQSEATRFVFSARTLPFLGRTAEISSLIQFLGNENASFRWMVMHGSGGVGKSRLALELCLAIRDGWLMTIALNFDDYGCAIRIDSK